MKLRNKKTGEIIETHAIFENAFGNIRIRKKGEAVVSYPYEYNSLAELNDDWEDAPEEPKEYWFMDEEGDISSFDYAGNDYDKRMQAIGNFFETKEEAEKAVEKLKAWKRMKDTGCKPITWRWKQDYPNDACYVEVVLKCQFDSGVHDKELDLLFGGEE